MDVLEHLIKDEIEAIVGYNKAILTIKDAKIVAKLTEIRNEEARHIIELNQLIKGDK